MQPSISTHLFVYQSLQENHLDLILESGFTNVELWGMPPHVRWSDRKRVDQILSWFERRPALKALTFHLPFYNEFGSQDFHWTYFNHPDQNIREEALALACHIVDLCPEFGCDLAIFHGNGWQGEDLPASDKRYRQYLDRFLPHCRKRGVRIAIENIMTPMSRCEQLRKLVDDYDTPELGICIDTGHAYIYEDLPACIETAGGKLLAMHIADNYGENDDHLLPFEGKIDWFEAWNKIKVNCKNLEAFTFEPSARFTPTGTAQDVDYYRQILARAQKVWQTFISGTTTPPDFSGDQ